MNMIDEEEADMTLKQSPDQQQLVSRIEYEDYDDASVPILQFDLNYIGSQGEDVQLPERDLNTSKCFRDPDNVNVNNAVSNFMLMTQQSTQSNGMQKRTLSHNDLVQLGTVQGQQLATQRSFSNQNLLEL